MPGWSLSGLWGLVAGSALIVGTLIGYFVRVPQRIVASVMGFGAGVLISALSFELMTDSYRRGGLLSCAIGFLAASGDRARRAPRRHTRVGRDRGEPARRRLGQPRHRRGDLLPARS